MRLLTWNINSVRLRLPLLQQIIRDVQPDVICLQETKCPDEVFPLMELHGLGYTYTHLWGQKSYNGQAILSKHPFTDPKTYARCGQEDCRHISVRFPAFELHNLYIPSGGSGGDLPDPETNPKFRHKLSFVEEMTAWFAQTYTPESPLIAVGDFNIAPYEHDVWSHKQLLKVISHTPDETTRLEAMRASLDWIDTRTHFIPATEKAYSWWSYRSADWKKNNRGRRLDHTWVTEPLRPALKSMEIQTKWRGADKPSDHVPVILDLSA
ncbi:MAG: exodeoxyribonuclease III [Rhodospirillales bacterium]|nr:exodeoxyribonuclease III [Rhodospirillales bacterium]MCB9965861.1 exodeoxyribonuclease III [Rhodospirillales bacterium]MCB9973378.1 exodeoxyribonuclease III [Rhodospirillales bacterium]